MTTYSLIIIMIIIIIMVIIMIIIIVIIIMIIIIIIITIPALKLGLFVPHVTNLMLVYHFNYASFLD